MILYINELILLTAIVSVLAVLSGIIQIQINHSVSLIKQSYLAYLSAIVKGKMNGYAALDNHHQRC